MNQRFNTIAVLVLLLGTVAASTATQGVIELKAVAETEIEVTLEDGSKETRRITAETVVPGDEVIYTIFYTNVGTEPAEEVTITNPVPQHMQLEGIDDTMPTFLTFSVDGGKTFDVAKKLVVQESGTERVAQLEDYTHVRWVLLDPVAPGVTGQVGFRARLQ